MMPISAGMKIDAKNSHIWGPKPDSARKLPIEVRYAPHTANSRKFIRMSLRLTLAFFM